MSTRTSPTSRRLLRIGLAVVTVAAFAACETSTTAPSSGDLLTVQNPDGSTPPDGSALATGGKALLRVRAVNDVPGPVTVNVHGWDVHGDMVVDATLTWDDDDNVFSVEQTMISKKTRILRLTFVGDQFAPGDPDLDRNAFIDAFWVNFLRYEAEDFDRTGGPDPQFPGCGSAMITDAASEAATVADCGNEGDWVEFDLHPGNPMGRGKGLRRP